MSFAHFTDLIEALRRYHLLEPEQLEQLARSPSAPQFLARDLVQRGWLSPYQVNQLFRGAGEELLLGSYVLIDRLGEGGMGQVFKARNWKLGKIVALKLIRRERLAKADAVRRFQREIRAAAQLNHANVIHAYDADAVGGVHFFTMEYVEGHDLDRLVQEHGPLPVEQACEYIRQAALGLQHAHERGLIHRDIKPANLLVTGGGQYGLVKLLDMGLAKVLQGADETTMVTALTAHGTIIGTCNFIAPEQARDASEVDIRADLYSLGCTLYFLLTGKPPFAGGTPAQKLLRHQNEAPRPVETLRPEVPAPISQIVRRLLAKDARDRYPTPAALAAALDAAMANSHGLQAVSSPRSVAPAANPFEGLSSVLDPAAAALPEVRRRWWPRAAGGVLLLMLGGILFGLWRSGPIDEQAAAEPPTIVVRVAAQSPWQDSGVDVENGKTLQLAVRGQWHKGPLAVGARGVLDESTDRAVLPEAPALCLLGRIGATGEPVAFGVAPTFRPKQSGRLFLQANDLDVPQLVGSLEVDIKGGTPGPAAAPPGPTRVQEAEAALQTLLARTVKTAADQEQRRGELLHVLAKYGGTLQGLRAAELLRPLPSPLDQLDPARIPPEELAVAGGGDPTKAPVELVAVFGSSRRKGPMQHGVALCPDGRRLAAVSDGGAVNVWDTTDGKELLTYVGSGVFYGVAFSPDGEYLAAGTKMGQLLVWDRALDSEPRSLAGLANVKSVAFSHQDQRLAAVGEDKVVMVWDAASGQQVRTLHGHTSAVCQVAFSPDGQRLASSALGPDSTVRVWDARTGQPLHTLEGPMGAIWGLAYSPDNRHLAAGAGAGTVRIWDTDRGAEVRQLSVTNIHRVAYSPDGTVLATLDRIPNLMLWARTGALLRRWLLPGRAQAIAFASDGRHVVTANDNGTVYVLRLGAPAPLPRPWTSPAVSPFDQLQAEQVLEYERTMAGSPQGLVAVLGDSRLKHWGEVSTVAFRPDGKHVAAGDYYGTIKVWDPDTGHELLSHATHGGGHVVAVAYAPDGTRLASTGYDGILQVREAATGRSLFAVRDAGTFGVAYSPDGTRLATASTRKGKLACLWDAQTGKVLHKLQGHTERVNAVAFSPDGSRLATAAEDKTARIWDAATGKELHTLPHSDSVLTVAYRPGGRELTSVSGNSVFLWDAESGKPLPPLPVHPGVNALAYRPDGQRLAVADGLGGITIWEMPTRQELRTLRGHAGAARSLAFSTDGKRLVSGGADGTVRLWDPQTGRELLPIPGPAGRMFSVAVRPDGQHLTAAGGDYLLHVWDVARGKERGQFKGHTAPVRRVVYSPDGRVLASGAEDATVRLWHAATGHEFALLRHDSAVQDVAFAPDGQRLASASNDRSARVWDALTGRECWAVKCDHYTLSAAFSGDSRRVAVGLIYAKHSVLDGASGREVFAVAEHGRERVAAFSPDNQHLAVGSSSGLFVLCNAATGKEVVRVPGDPALALAYRPDGQALAAASITGGLYLCDGVSGKTQHEWRLRGPVWGLAFAPDGRHLITANGNGTLYVLRLQAAPAGADKEQRK
jgi:WD40 repeat protein/serine/threonine protein kinase